MDDEKKYEIFVEMMREISIFEKYNPTLLENGFDEWASICEIDQKVLGDIGIADELDQQRILACKHSVQSIHDDKEVMNSDDYQYSTSNMNNNKYSNMNGNDSVPILISEHKYQEDGDENADGYSEQEGQMYHTNGYVQVKVKPIPVQVEKVQKYSFTKINKNENEKKYFARVLNLYAKNIGLNSMQNAEHFTGIRVLDISNNMIHKIEMLQACVNIETLNLESNSIQKMEGLECLQNLKKLYLSKNRIKRVEGLAYSGALQILYVNQQNMTNDDHMTLEEDSMIGISNSLEHLEMNEVRLKDTHHLRHLRYVHTVSLKNNLIESVESLYHMLIGCSSLAALSLQQNPIESVSKYRDHILMASSSVETLNEKKVLMHERQFLHEFYRRKK